MTLKQASMIAGTIGTLVAAAATVWQLVRPAESPSQTSTSTSAASSGSVSIQVNNNTVMAPSVGSSPNPDVDVDLIPGIWSYEYSYPGSRGSRVTVVGTSEFFNNGSYRARAKITFAGKSDNGERFEIAYDAYPAGDWTVIRRDLLTKMTDMKTVVLGIRLGFREADLDRLPLDVRTSLPCLEDFLPKGSTEKFEIVRLQRDRMRLRVLDPIGGFFEYDNMRRTARSPR